MITIYFKMSSIFYLIFILKIIVIVRFTLQKLSFHISFTNKIVIVHFFTRHYERSEAIYFNWIASLRSQ